MAMFALSGTQCTGKTTLLNMFREDKAFDDFMFIEEIVRTLRTSYNLSINESGNEDTQLLVNNCHIENLFKSKASKNHVMTDRCLLDSTAYSTYLYRHGDLPDWVQNYSLKIFERYISQYDTIFYIPPIFDNMIPDGVRSINKEFRDEVEQIFLDLMTTDYSPNIIQLAPNDTKQERYDFIKDYISNRITGN